MTKLSFTMLDKKDARSIFILHDVYFLRWKIG